MSNGSAVNFIPKDFNTFVSDQAGTWAADVGLTPLLQPGDPVLALFESNATVAIYLEALLQAVINMARLSTSSNGDVDTFVNDFGLTRLPASFATGTVTFTTNTPATQQIIIPIGTVVQTVGGAIQYQLVEDNTQAAFSDPLDAYIIQVGQSSITVTVTALVAGSASNVLAGLLTQAGSSISGVSQITNLNAIQNGLNVETDAALQARFVQYLVSLFKGTQAAILFAINSVQQGLLVNLLENTNSSNVFAPGFFTAVVDAGSGALPATLQAALVTAINNTRGFTIRFAVVPDILVVANIQMTFITGPNPNLPALETEIQNAISAYMATLGIGVGLYVSRLEQLAIDADPTILGVVVGSTLINGVNADLIPVDGFHRIVLGTMAIV